MSEEPCDHRNAVSSEIARFLAEFGLEVAPGGVILMFDHHRAETAHVHRSEMPVILTAFALISPAFARGRFPKVGVGEFVWQRPGMDVREIAAFNEVCGAAIKKKQMYRDAAAFSDHL
jgi:hypothetical protein